MQRAQIFISYRREDTAGYARAVYDALAREFGAPRVFIDVDDIAAGQPFDEAIDQAVGHSEVLLVLIGPRWLAGHDGGPPRLHEPGDFVRQEITAGLARGMRVIPLLFDGAAMPTAAQLPEPLQPLARRQALQIDAADFAADTAHLVAQLRQLLGQPTAAAPATTTGGRARRRYVVVAGAALAAVLLVGVLVHWWPPAAPPAATRPAINGRWQAEVDYDWPNAHYTERFDFAGEGNSLHGSASFLRVDRGIVDGQVDAGGLAFVTRSRETLGGDGPGQEVSHRYRGRLVAGAQGDELHVVMQTEGGSTLHRPVEFVARR